MKEMKCTFLNYNKGFTLIELAISLLVLSIILGAYFAVDIRSSFTKSDEVTQKNMQVIKQALLSFYNQNGYLPCPATLTGVDNDLGLATNCSAAAPSGISVAGGGVDEIRTGAVPIQNLNLPVEYFTDAWGSRIRYTVIKDLAIDARSFNNHTSPNTVIYMQSQGSGTNYNTTDKIAYVLVSVGPNQAGGNGVNGVLIQPCAGQSLSNCNGDEFFEFNFRDLTNTNSLGVNSDIRFDDYLTWQTYSQVKSEGDFYNSGNGYSLRYMLLGDFRTSGVNVGAGAFSQPTYPNVIWNSTRNVTFNGSNIITMNGPGTFTVKYAVIGCGIGLFNIFSYDPFDGNPSLPGSAEYSGPPTAGSCSPSFGEFTYTLGTGFSESIVLYYQLNGTNNFVDGGGRSVNISPGNYFSYVEVWEETR